MRLIPGMILVVLIGGAALGAGETSSGANLARALELLQKNEKTQALRLLERAFESTADSDELKQISILILEASPSNYPKREGYLQYLIKFNPDHADAWRWYKEMGDRAFDHARMDEAEDWYLRAKPLASDASVIQYKLAWVYWNLNRKVEAFQDFLDVNVTADATLSSQILKDLAKLWWEIGALPAAVYERALSLPDNQRSSLLENFIHSTPAHLEAGPTVEAQLFQLKSDDRSKDYFYRGLKTGFQFKASPCFLFNSILTPEDEFSKDNFLSCLKTKDRPTADKLMPYFAKIQDDSDERISWAAAELDIEGQKVSDAALRLLQFSGFNNATKDYHKFAAQVVMQLDEEGFRKLYEFLGASSFEVLVDKSGSEFLLERLEAVDTDHWLPIEEGRYRGKSIPKSFWLKKGIWIAQKPSPDLTELEKVFNSLLRPPLKSDEKKISEEFGRLSKRVNSKLPANFDLKFKKKYDEWIADIDRSLTGLRSSSADWQIVARPIFQQKIDKNIDQLISQIDDAKIDSKIDEVIVGFEQKKEELKNDLRLKYSTALKTETVVQP